MNIILKICLVTLLLFSESCDSAKSTAAQETKTTEQKQQMEEQLLAEGFSKGRLTAQKESKCTYIIIDERTGAQFDPINLEEGKFGDFKGVENELVYYKFLPLRRMNRCPEAQPISIKEIKKGSQ